MIADSIPEFKAKNGNWKIDIYKTPQGMWTFTGNGRSEGENSLVAGIDDMLEIIANTYGNDFYLEFGIQDMKVENCIIQIKLELNSDVMPYDPFNKFGIGNMYYCAELNILGWLCPVLFDFFDVAPEILYVYAVRKN